MESGPPGHEIALRNIKEYIGEMYVWRVRVLRARATDSKKGIKEYWKYYCFGVGNTATAPCAKQWKTFANSILSEATRGSGITKVAKTLQIVL